MANDSLGIRIHFEHHLPVEHSALQSTSLVIRVNSSVRLDVWLWIRKKERKYCILSPITMIRMSGSLPVLPIPVRNHSS
jgi:hypothetical protein